MAGCERRCAIFRHLWRCPRRRCTVQGRIAFYGYRTERSSSSFRRALQRAVQMAVVRSVAGRSVLTDMRALAEPVIDDATAKILATGWFDVCMLARSILRHEQTAPQLADAAIDEILADLTMRKRVSVT